MLIENKNWRRNGWQCNKVEMNNHVHFPSYVHRNYARLAKLNMLSLFSFCWQSQCWQLFNYRFIFEIDTCIRLCVCLIVFNATFNNISVISLRSVLLVEETGGTGENHRPVASHWQTLSHNVVRFALIKIRTHNIKSNNFLIRITKNPNIF